MEQQRKQTDIRDFQLDVFDKFDALRVQFRFLVEQLKEMAEIIKKKDAEIEAFKAKSTGNPKKV